MREEAHDRDEGCQASEAGGHAPRHPWRRRAPIRSNVPADIRPVAPCGDPDARDFHEQRKRERPAQDNVTYGEPPLACLRD